MSYFLNVIVLVICVATPFYWEGWHEGFCEVEFLCYRGEPNWLGYMVFFGGLFCLWWFLEFWKGPRKGHIDDDR